MSSNMTWVQVAHYYAKNEAVPDVYVTSRGKWYPYTSPYPFGDPGHDHLPDLLDLADITEEDAREVLAMASISATHGSARGFFNLSIKAQDPAALSVAEYVIGTCPAAIHYLLSRNYNIFNIPTYKAASGEGDKP